MTVQSSQKLTKRIVEAAAPSVDRFVLWDGELKGFGLRVETTGTKTFIVRYRAAGGRSGIKRLFSLGRFGIVTVEQARVSARQVLGAVAQGNDPAADRAKQREQILVRDLAHAFLNQHVEIKRKPSTARHYTSLLNLYVLPVLGRKPAEGITSANISKLHNSLSHAPYQANRLVAVVGAMYSFGRRQGLVADQVNPVKQIEKFKEKRREHFLSVADIEQLGSALRSLLAEGQISNSAAYAIRVLALTGARVGEILGLKWSEIDFERAIALLPESKTGQKTLYLNQAVREILRDISSTPENPYVFSGRRKGQCLQDLKGPWRLIKAEAGLERTRLHDLRHTFASVGASAHLSLPIIGKLLGHTQAATTARYAHLADDPLRLANETIGHAISRALVAGSGESRF